VALDLPEGVSIDGVVSSDFEKVLTKEAVAFVADLQRRFNPRREELLAARAERQKRLDAGEKPDFLPETAEIRESDWTVAPLPQDILDRRVEITGPVDRKMIINALNCGANVFMADFEDANTPTWANQVEGQLNLLDAVEGMISYESADGRHYALDEQVATLLVRPRGWHLNERHVRVGDRPLAGAFLDFGLALFHLGQRQLDRGSAPYYYLPKLEHHLEARLWNDVFVWAQDALAIPQGSIRATVLIETLPAAFQMEELLFELRDHSYGLNAGRWDYIFSAIKSFRERPDFITPDRMDVKMTAPFMRAYTQLLVATCHRRGAFAMGGMAAIIPSRDDAEANARAIAGVQADKHREATDGFDGTWVAHPDLVPVARRPFDAVLGDRPNQLDRSREDVSVTAEDLLNFAIPGGEVTEEGLGNDVAVGLRYLSAWLTGNGAAGIFNLMEDVATAEIARSQVWQWIRRGRFDTAMVRGVVKEEVERIRAEGGGDRRLDEAEALFAEVALGSDYPEFLTLPGYVVLE